MLFKNDTKNQLILPLTAAVIIVLFTFSVNTYSKEPQPKNHAKTLNKGYNMYPDEYSELDDIPTPSSTNDEIVRTILEKSRQQYLQALMFIEKKDTTKAALYFEKAINFLNKLVNYPAIEQNQDFSDLAQSIIEDYESYVKNIDDMDENSSLFIIRDKLFQEIDNYISKGELEIKSILVPKEPKPVAGLTPEIQDFVIPMDSNVHVQKNLSFLTNTKTGKVFIKKCLERSGKWFPLLKKLAKEESMPPEIIYLACVESALNANAVSKAKAVGMWQFIKTTGEMYGLNANGSIWLDERRDPEKATKAALRHLKDLYNDLGNWHLALAAYNAGQGCVNRAVTRSQKESPSFWDLLTYLPRETRNYVPLFIATTKIAMEPEAYGFDLSEMDFHKEYKYDTLTIFESCNLGAIAKCAGVSEEDIRDLNPELIRHCTPPDITSYTLKIPAGARKTIADNYSKLTDEEKQPWIFHEVKKGETLSKIADQYDVSKEEIASINGLNSYKSKLHGGTMLKIPLTKQDVAQKIQPEPQDNSQQTPNASVPSDPRQTSAASQTAVQDSSKNLANNITYENKDSVNGNNPSTSQNIIHIVAKGETLYSIAQRYGIRITDLRNLNNMPYDEDNIALGTKLIIAQNEIQPQKPESDISKIKLPKIVKHQVKAGETLASIADDYGVTTSSIIKLNKIKKNKISTGKTLKIETLSDAKKAPNQEIADKYKDKVTHKVKKGENLNSIATKYGVKESDLVKWNPDNIDGTTVFTGTTLKIYPNKTSKGSSSSTTKKGKNPPKYYKIRSGDTLAEIADKFGVSVSSLKKNNKNLNEKNLQIGKKIRLQ